MATNYQLTWVGTRWRKMYKGQWFSFAGVNGKVASYPAALQAFREWKDAVDEKLKAGIESQQKKFIPSQGSVSTIAELKRLQVEILDRYCDSAELRSAYDSIEVLIKRAGTIDTSHCDTELVESARTLCESLLADAVEQSVVGIEVNLRKEKVRFAIQPPEKPAGLPRWQANSESSDSIDTIGQAITAYKEARRSKVESKDLTAAKFNNESIHLKKFQNFVGEKTTILEVTPRVLESYRQHVSREAISDSTKNDRLRVVKSIFSWLYSMEIIENEPRNLRKGYSFEVTASAIVLPRVEDIREMLAASTPRVRLFALLALNCGMTQADISDLKPAEYDAKKKTIRRKRSKTQGKENVPTVTYYLWPEVVELLNEFAGKTKSTKHLLTNEDGNPLKSEGLGTNDEFSKTDAIDSAWDRVRRKTKKKNSTFKILRKLSSSILASHEAHGRYAQYFLGHAPDNIAERHYVVPSEERFSEALAWLRGQILGSDKSQTKAKLKKPS